MVTAQSEGFVLGPPATRIMYRIELHARCFICADAQSNVVPEPQPTGPGHIAIEAARRPVI